MIRIVNILFPNNSFEKNVAAKTGGCGLAGLRGATPKGLSSPACRSRRSQTVSIQEWYMALSRLGCRRPDKKAASSEVGETAQTAFERLKCWFEGFQKGPRPQLLQ